ncbi:hypothetical protein [Actinoplanes sp. NPDC048796]|uniref:hypothetical protein n=1 Tax=Actinoplanes sp. NPDC048796 TaxID=3155640 RepID=UPI0033EDCB06
MSESPSTVSSGRPGLEPAGVRTPKTSPTDSASSRRATKVRISSDIRSSHCTSSTTQIRGRCDAASANSPSTASPTSSASGGFPAARPTAVASTARCGAGSRSRFSSRGAQSCCNAE